MEDQSLAKAIALVQEGKKVEGRNMLLEVVNAEPENEKAWLWLAACTDADAQKQVYLNNVLAIQTGRLDQVQPIRRPATEQRNVKTERPARGKPSWLREYWMEIAVGVMTLSGVFLLVEPFEIRETLFKWANRILDALGGGSNAVAKWLQWYINSFTLSDLTGWTLLILSGIFISWRVRVRYLRSATWKTGTCPRCGGSLHRIHRSFFDKVVGKVLFPHSRRYLCANPACGWSGLRRHSHTGSEGKRGPTGVI